MPLVVRTFAGDIVHEKPPDGGWAWVVMIASFFNTAIAFGIAKGLGIFFMDFMQEFEVSNSQASFVLSITLSLFGLGAPFATCLQHKIGARKLIMISGLLCCCGMIIAAFAQNIYMLYIGIGLINGLGFSWSFLTCVSQIGMYFDKWRPTVNGLTFAGSSVASTVMPFLNDYLLQNYGWRGAMFIFAGIGLNISLCGALIRPISIIRKKSKEMDTGAEVSLPGNNNDSVQNETVVASLSIGHRIAKFFRTYWVVMLLGLGEMVTCMGLFVPIVFIVPFARSLGYGPSEAALILSMVSIGDIICRPLGGVLITLIPAFRRNVLLYICVGSFAMGAVQIIAALSQVFSSLVIYAVLFGVIYGLLTPASITAVPMLLGLENIQKYMGLKFLATGLTSFIGAPFAGFLIDVFETYRVAFWYVLITFSVTGCLYFVTSKIVARLGAVLPEHRPCKDKDLNIKRDEESPGKNS